MNCQIPAALAREYALGENPLSMNGRYTRSSGIPRRRSACRIIGA
jgi:hypothetical protein